MNGTETLIWTLLPDGVILMGVAWSSTSLRTQMEAAPKTYSIN
jgi:hypothetical protein